MSSGKGAHSEGLQHDGICDSVYTMRVFKGVAAKIPRVVYRCTAQCCCRKDGFAAGGKRLKCFLLHVGGL